MPRIIRSGWFWYIYSLDGAANVCWANSCDEAFEAVRSRTGFLGMLLGYKL